MKKLNYEEALSKAKEDLRQVKEKRPAGETKGNNDWQSDPWYLSMRFEDMELLGQLDFELDLSKSDFMIEYFKEKDRRDANAAEAAEKIKRRDVKYYMYVIA